MLGILGFLFMLPIALFGFLATIFWVWMLIDCALHESNDGNEKLIWVLIILFTHFIGALIYFLVRRINRRTSY